MTRPTNQQIIDAWNDNSAWASGLGAAATGLALPNTSTTGQIEVCNLLNGPSYGQRHTLWEQGSDGSMSLSSLKISSFTGTAVATPTFPDADHVDLPVAFTTLTVIGRYSYSQPCQLWNVDLDKKSGKPSNTTGTGGISQSASGGQLVYRATIADSDTTPLVLQSVRVTNAGKLSVSPDQSGPDWLNAIAGFLTGWNREGALIANMIGSVFASAPFTTTMLDQLNKVLTGNAKAGAK